jgi:hypothetical protein
LERIRQITPDSAFDWRWKLLTLQGERDEEEREVEVGWSAAE